MKNAGAVNTKATKDIYDRAVETFDKLDSGKIDVDDAKARASILRPAVAQTKLELEHAKLTGRLAPGSASLPGFVRTPAEDIQAEVANKRIHRPSVV